jgi:hypothetical protein
MGTRQLIHATLVGILCTAGGMACGDNQDTGNGQMFGDPNHPSNPFPNNNDPNNPGNGNTGGTGGINLPPTPACEGDCCPSISGRVFSPGGDVPLYNVVVYVPIGEVEPVPEGVQCGRCATSVRAYSSTLTDTEGRFTLHNVPPGDDVSVVMQVGKWQREVKTSV